ncbi:hypothetical protein Dda_9350 [Drechslerella dactyloides]|uniref:Endonuclease/exonuclease/phosphatase domain-containing protein n=1 Tax=Drechslerella dactyloides TaxID=74499 RepID=A0AAD6IPK5_DREDA|nr:hypothetical protein Dda_9350 [Drechslerella dactyloides]
MLFSSVFSAAASALFFSMSLVQAAPTAGGSLAVTNGDLVTFSYSTTDPNEKNWIGVYHASGGGPVNGEKVSESLIWDWAPANQGTLRLDVTTFEPGQYVAFFLARDGYKSLASPVNFNVPKPAPQQLSFIISQMTLHNARQKDAYTAKLAGLVAGGNGGVRFAKESGASWVQVSADGTLSGTPSGSDGDANVVVSATAGGAKSTLKINIPVKKTGTPLVSQFRVMTFNLWIGGTRVNNYHNKQIKFLVESNVDIVGVQEATGDHPKRIANALGWYYYSGGDLGIISRYPIVAEHGHVSASIGVRIALDGTATQINFWDAHLSAYPYGPYDFCVDNRDINYVIRREGESGRTQQVIDTLKAMAPQIAAANNVPVILMGDTNAPSHLDWTNEARDLHCGFGGVPWPTSVKPMEAGLIDSFRVAHPDPVAVPGNTWSPLYPFADGATGRPEPQDRIDIIYHAGKLAVVDSQVVFVGTPKLYGQHQNNEWTSDHAAVITTYRL